MHSGTPRSPGSNDAVWVQIPLSGSSDQNDTVPGGQPAAVEMYPSHVPGEPTTAVSPSLEIPVDSPKRLPPAAVGLVISAVFRSTPSVTSQLSYGPVGERCSRWRR